MSAQNRLSSQFEDRPAYIAPGLLQSPVGVTPRSSIRVVTPTGGATELVDLQTSLDTLQGQIISKAFFTSVDGIVVDALGNVVGIYF